MLPLFWSWYIYASCFARTGRPWADYNFKSEWLSSASFLFSFLSSSSLFDIGGALHPSSQLFAWKFDHGNPTYNKFYLTFSVFRADSDIWLIWSTSCGGSRHSTMWSNLICFPASHIYFFVGGGQSVYPNWMGPWPDFSPMDLSLSVLYADGPKLFSTCDWNWLVMCNFSFDLCFLCFVLDYFWSNHIFLYSIIYFYVVLASSGIDYDVKIWMPALESSGFDQPRAAEVMRQLFWLNVFPYFEIAFLWGLCC